MQPDPESLQVYPNPASGYLTVRCSEEITAVALYDLSGKLVLRSTDAREFEQINLSAVPQGIYLLHVSTKSATLHRKLLIE